MQLTPIQKQTGQLAAAKLLLDCEMAVQVRNVIEEQGWLPHLLEQVRNGMSANFALKTLWVDKRLPVYVLRHEAVRHMVARRLEERAGEADGERGNREW